MSDESRSTTNTAPSLATIASLGMAQIIAWGASYFFIAVIADPVVADTGWPHARVLGASSIGILVSGLLAKRTAWSIDRFGGRAVLAASAVVLAAGLVILGLASSFPLFIAAWVVLGAGMAAGLYDALFSVLGRLHGENARRAITHVTLVSGFSATLTWPLTAFLVHRVGWRGACFFYGAALVGIVLPIYLLVIPSATGVVAKSAAAPEMANAQVTARRRRLRLLLEASFALASVVMTAVSVQLIALLRATGLSAQAAIGLGALIGPSQVAARGLEIFFARRRHPVWSFLASTVLVAVGLLLTASLPRLAVVGVTLYGTGSGVRAIVRGTLPLALFHKDEYVAEMARIARPVLIAQAATPFLVGTVLDTKGPGVTMMALCVVALVNVALVAALIPNVLFPRPS